VAERGGSCEPESGLDHGRSVASRALSRREEQNQFWLDEVGVSPLPDQPGGRDCVGLAQLPAARTRSPWRACVGRAPAVAAALGEDGRLIAVNQSANRPTSSSARKKTSHRPVCLAHRDFQRASSVPPRPPRQRRRAAASPRKAKWQAPIGSTDLSRRSSDRFHSPSFPLPMPGRNGSQKRLGRPHSRRGKLRGALAVTAGPTSSFLLGRGDGRAGRPRRRLALGAC